MGSLSAVLRAVSGAVGVSELDRWTLAAVESPVSRWRALGSYKRIVAA